jgi:hypothetical protein
MAQIAKQSKTQLLEEIEIFIQYSVTESEQQLAKETVQRYEENLVALRVIRDFYATLPEFRQEAVCKVTRIVSRHDSYLIGVDTQKHEYLYFYSDKQPVYIGEKKDGIGEDALLSFFGYSSNEDFLKNVRQGTENDDHLKMTAKNFCPACAVAEGEYHHLGCPVEICPWCDGQFTYCNCRFEKLAVEEIDDEAMLERLIILLNNKGRIPFSKSHAPAYPAASDEPDDITF